LTRRRRWRSFLIPFPLVLLFHMSLGAATMLDDSESAGYVHSLEENLFTARSVAESPHATEDDLITLSQACLDAGDDLYSDPARVRKSIKKGQKLPCGSSPSMRNTPKRIFSMPRISGTQSNSATGRERPCP
jgi:hypothetical protein